MTTTDAAAAPSRHADHGADPFARLADWTAAAHADGVREPAAMALATAGRDGRTSSRTVAVLSADRSGLVFATFSHSRKARDIASTGWASGVLYWRESGRQVIVAGPVGPTPDAESDVLWAGRPSWTRPMSVASRQSAPMEDSDVEPLRAEARRLATSGSPLPRPPEWIGYRLRPSTVEFWESDPERMYLRLLHELDGDGAWSVRRLQP